MLHKESLLPNHQRRATSLTTPISCDKNRPPNTVISSPGGGRATKMQRLGQAFLSALSEGNQWRIPRQDKTFSVLQKNPTSRTALESVPSLSLSRKGFQSQHQSRSGKGGRRKGFSTSFKSSSMSRSPSYHINGSFILHPSLEKSNPG